MTNAIICYTGNVCSTPMIEYARSCERIFVPVREHFDHQKLRNAGHQDDAMCRDMAEVLSHLYDRKSHPILVTGKVGNYHGRNVLPDQDSVPHTFFKWRPFPLEFDRCEKIRDVLAQFDVWPNVMLRRSLVALSLKLHLSKKVYGTRHPQFAAGRMSADEYESYRQSQDEIAVTLDATDLKAVRESAAVLFHRTVSLFRRVNFYFPDVGPDAVIVAEEIFKPEIDFQAYSKALSKILQDDIAIDSGGDIPVRKAGLEVSNCANPELIMSDDVLGRLEEKYASLIDGKALGAASDAELLEFAQAVPKARASLQAKVKKIFSMFR